MIPTITNPLDDFKLNLPIETTTSTLSQYYPEINQAWEVASQQVNINGLIISREYSLLSFPPTDTKLVKVDLGVYDPEWEADFYYLLISYFIETSYTSNNQSTVELPFNEWSKIDTEFRQEKYYKHKLIETLEWERPTFDSVDDSGFLPLPEDYTLTINVGNALGATIQINSNVEVRLKSTIQSEGVIVDKNFILLTEPYLEVKFKNVTDFSHTQLTVNFYGEFVYLDPKPNEYFTEQETFTLIHPFGTTYEDRLKPPGLANLPDNFWNTNFDQLPSVDFTNRSNQPQWI